MTGGIHIIKIIIMISLVPDYYSILIPPLRIFSETGSPHYYIDDRMWIEETNHGLSYVNVSIDGGYM